MPDPKTYTQEEYDALVTERDAAKNHNKELFGEAKKAKDALKNYDGVDPEKYKQLLSASEEAERKRAAGEGDWKALETQLKDLHSKEIGAKDSKIGKMTKALEKRAIRNELQNALIKADALPDMIDLLIERGEKSARIKETDDDFVAYIADEKGNPLVADGAGTPMDFATFVEKTLKVQYPRAFAGTGSSGGGASKSNAGGGGSKSVVGDQQSFLKNVTAISKREMTVKVDPVATQ